MISIINPLRFLIDPHTYPNMSNYRTLFHVGSFDDTFIYKTLEYLSFIDCHVRNVINISKGENIITITVTGSTLEFADWGQLRNLEEIGIVMSHIPTFNGFRMLSSLRALTLSECRLICRLIIRFK